MGSNFGAATEEHENSNHQYLDRGAPLGAPIEHILHFVRVTNFRGKLD